MAAGLKPGEWVRVRTRHEHRVPKGFRSVLLRVAEERLAGDDRVMVARIDPANDNGNHLAHKMIETWYLERAEPTEEEAYRWSLVTLLQ